MASKEKANNTDETFLPLNESKEKAVTVKNAKASNLWVLQST